MVAGPSIVTFFLIYSCDVSVEPVLENVMVSPSPAFARMYRNAPECMDESSVVVTVHVFASPADAQPDSSASATPNRMQCR